MRGLVVKNNNTMTPKEIKSAIESHENQIKLLERLLDRTIHLNGIMSRQGAYSNPEHPLYGAWESREKDEQMMSQMRGQIKVLKSGIFKMYRDAIPHDASEATDHLAIHLQNDGE
jgi:hypothetical protein